MGYGEVLAIAANCAAVLTAAIAILGYRKFRLDRSKRRKALEEYLREEKSLGLDQDKRTVLHLMSNLAMTEAEVLQAGFDSKKIRSSPGIDDHGRANCVFFEYDGDDVPAPKKL